MPIKKFIDTIQKMPEFKDLPADIKGKILFLGNNPEARILRLSDPQRGSLSNTMFGLASSIDSVKPVIAEIFNCRIKTKDPEVFFNHFAEYGREQHDAIESLKKLEAKGFELLKDVENPSSIRNRRVRERVFGSDDSETNTSTTKTSTAKKTTTKRAATKTTATKKTTTKTATSADKKVTAA